MEKEKVECPVIINGNHVIVTVPMGGKRDMDAEEFYNSVLYYCKKHPAYKQRLKDDEINTVTILLKENEMSDFTKDMRKFLASGKTYRIAGVLVSIKLLSGDVKLAQGIARTEPVIVPKPLNDRVVVLQDDVDNVSESGLVKEANSVRPLKGKVVAVGLKVEEVKVDDRISFVQWGSTVLEHDGVNYLVLREFDCETILP